MSARDDYPVLASIGHFDDALTRQMTEALREIDNLRRWKMEALTVLAEWDEVWETAGRPGPLGGSKARIIQQVLLDNERER